MYGKNGPRVTERAGMRKSRSWTLCDGDFRAVCELLGSFYFFTFFILFVFFFLYPAGESSRRRLFLPCVVSLEESNVIFYHAERVVTCQRDWERNKDRIKTETALTAPIDTFLSTLVGLHHFKLEASSLWNLSCLNSTPPRAPLQVCGYWCANWKEVILQSLPHKVHAIQAALLALFIFKVPLSIKNSGSAPSDSVSWGRLVVLLFVFYSIYLFILL